MTLIRFSLVLLILFLIRCIVSDFMFENNLSNYLLERQKIIDEEQAMAFGASIILDEDERRANDVLMTYKYDEINKAFTNPRIFLPSNSFMEVSREVEFSKVFQIIRAMPKGGVLHAHISAINSRDFILKNITQRPHLYVCRVGGRLKLRFLDKDKMPRKRCQWQLLAQARLRDDGQIDAEISEALTMYTKQSKLLDAGSEEAWKKFLNIFRFLKSLITYRPVYEDFLYHIMEELYEDNIQFMEVRTPFSTLYELNGYQYDHLEVIDIYKKVVDRFLRDHPDFVGVKWIYSPQRNVSLSKFAEYLKKFRRLRKAHPDIVVGFDLVGQEDKGRPLKDFVHELRNLRAETRFFFHAGETNWNGLEADENLLDAILLNTTRIGHGFALMKHPRLKQLVKERDIAIEINPISNQVLQLVRDLRNHPASSFFAEGLPVVVSSDDPGFWGASALSYDFYEAFLGMMSSSADLRSLKQLALNSITYSSLSDSEKSNLMSVWDRRWRSFILGVTNAAS